MISLILLLAYTLSAKSLSKVEGRTFFTLGSRPVNRTANAFDAMVCANERCYEAYPPEEQPEKLEACGLCCSYLGSMEAAGQGLSCSTLCSYASQAGSAISYCDEVCPVALGSSGGGGDTMSEDEKDCRKRCDDKMDGDYKVFLDECYAGCEAKSGKCPYDGYSDCKSKMKGEDARARSNEADMDKAIEKYCSAICPKSIWWVFLIVGLVVVIAVVVVLILVCFFKKLLCFASKGTVVPTELQTVDTSPSSSD